MKKRSARLYMVLLHLTLLTTLFTKNRKTNVLKRSLSNSKGDQHYPNSLCAILKVRNLHLKYLAVIQEMIYRNDIGHSVNNLRRSFNWIHLVSSLKMQLLNSRNSPPETLDDLAKDVYSFRSTDHFDYQLEAVLSNHAHSSFEEKSEFNVSLLEAQNKDLWRTELEPFSDLRSTPAYILLPSKLFNHFLINLFTNALEVYFQKMKTHRLFERFSQVKNGNLSKIEQDIDMLYLQSDQSPNWRPRTESHEDRRSEFQYKIKITSLNERFTHPSASAIFDYHKKGASEMYIHLYVPFHEIGTFVNTKKASDPAMKYEVCFGTFVGTLLAQLVYMIGKKKDGFRVKHFVNIHKRKFARRFIASSQNHFSSSVLPDFLFQWRNILPLNGYFVYPLQRNGEIDVSSYLHRLGTFKTRIKDIPIQGYKLASEGFYALDTPKLTKCFSCGFQYSSWKAEDDPRKIHLENSPDCPYLRKDLNDNVDSETGNSVPHTDSTSATASNGTTGTQTSGTTSDEASTSKGTCKNDDDNVHDRGTANERHTIICYSVGTNQSSQLSIDEYPSRIHSEDGGITNHHNHQSLHRAANLDTRNNTAVQNGLHPSPQETSVTETASIDGPILDRPRYPSFAVLTIRISSFQGWPGNHTQTPKELALAGFLYAGYGDYVRCYFCGGGLRNWEPGDDPWVEHARWFPRCGFLRQSKGEDFIQLVRDSVNQETSQENNEDGDSMNSTFEDAKQSVAEMGYSTRKIEEAVQKLMHDDKTVTAASILDLLLDENETSYNSIESEDHKHSLSESGAMAQSNASENAPSVLYQRGKHLQRQTANSQTNSEAGSTETSVSSRLDSLSISSSSGLKSGTASAEDTTSLREENRQLRSLKQCKVCLDRDASIAFLPCGHLVCCSECAPALRRCPICRGYIKGSIKTWLA